MLSLVLITISICIIALTTSVNGNVYTQTINLGSCSNFAVQAGSSANFNGIVTQIPTGNVGVSPGTSITGNYVLGTGSTEDNSAAAVSCAADEATAYSQAQGVVCTPANNLAVPDLGGVTLAPGVYCSVYMEITAASLTLDGQGNSAAVWVFQTSTTVITGVSTSIILINGAQASNVFWAVGTAVTIGPSATFAGTILAGTAITLDAGASLTGRALAETAVVCSSGNTITLPSSTTEHPSSQPSGQPSSQPSTEPSTHVVTSVKPSSLPTILPSSAPSSTLTVLPTHAPTVVPSVASSFRPTSIPSTIPSSLVTERPSFRTT
jgi:hypothetical protein